MAAHQEVYTFVNKSMSLCKNGDNANLSLSIMAVLLSTFKFVFANILLHLTIHTNHLTQVRMKTQVVHDLDGLNGMNTLDMKRRKSPKQMKLKKMIVHRPTMKLLQVLK